jgi:site-specific recombinase XerD
VTDDLRSYLRGFAISLRARNRAPRTVSTYAFAVEQFGTWLEDTDRPTALDRIDRQTIEAYLAHLVDTRSAATASQRYSSLRQFFRWCVEEGELAAHPMDGLRKPSVPDKPVPIYTDDDLRALLDACAGSSFTQRRDTALLRVFIDTGARLSEVADLTVEAVDLDRQQFATVVKGGHVQVRYFGHRTAQALDRYERVRRRHRHAPLPWLWLSPRGRLTANGVRQAIERIGAQAGVPGAHAHRFRHTFAHRWLADGGGEGDLVRLLGWKDRQMVARYGSSAAQGRAEEAYRRSPLVDRL